MDYNQLLVELGVEATVALVILLFLFKYYIPSYFSQKGKNLATKEDVAQITEQVEAVKANYVAIHEEIKSDHQIRIAAIEREKLIKKEVYLAGVESITRVQQLVAQYSNLDILSESISKEYSNDVGIIAKVQIVGTEETVKAVTSFMSSVSEVALSLMLGRAPLIQRKQMIELKESYRDKSQLELDRYISIMKDLNIQGNTDKAKWGALDRSANLENEHILQLNTEIQELHEEQREEHIKYVEICMEKYFEITTLLPEVVLAVRKELDMGINEEDFIKVFDQNVDRGKRIFDEFLMNIKQS